jgi:hypothetical protein
LKVGAHSINKEIFSIRCAPPRQHFSKNALQELSRGEERCRVIGAKAKRQNK